MRVCLMKIKYKQKLKKKNIWWIKTYTYYT